MRILGWWLVGGLAICSGYGLGDLHPQVGRELGVTAFLVAAGLGVAVAAKASGALGLDPRWWVVGVLLALAGRGALAAADDQPGAWSSPRGPAAGLTALTIEGASHPGPRCRARARAAGSTVWLDAPPEACPLAEGQRVRVVAARLHRHTTPELPGDRSPATFARSHGAVALATIDRVWPAGGEPSLYWSWVARQRQRAWESTRGDRAASFVVAAALGVRSALAPTDRDALRRSGLGHLVAVSGLHVGLAAWALLAFSLRVGARFGGAHGMGVIASWLPLLAYVLLTGASPPAVRAGLMAAAVGLSGIVGRPHHGPVALVATCVCMLVVRPAWAFDPGFQLSAVAMATLVRAPIGESIVRQTWRVSWAVLPLSLWHFGHAGVWGMVSNLVAIPMFTLWVLPLGLLGWLATTWLGAAALEPASWGAQLIIDTAGMIGAWPTPPGWSVAGLALVSAIAAVVWGRRDAQGRLRPRWGWVPPIPVAIAVVVVLAWPSPSGAPVMSWWAAGSPRAPAVVTVVRGASSPVACIHQASLAPSRWRTLLDAVEVPTAGFAPEASPSSARPPHALAVQRALVAQRRWVEQPRGCPAPPTPSTITRAMEQCRREAGTRHTMVGETPQGLVCFVGGRWSSPRPLLDSTAHEVS